MKNEGIHATVVMIETIKTVCGMEPSNGLMSCASYEWSEEESLA